MSKNIRGIFEKLDIDSTPESEEIISEPLELIEDEYIFSENYIDDIDSDYKFIRSKLRKSVAICETVLNHSLKTVNDELSSRNIDSMANIVKQMIQATKELQDMHQKQLSINRLKKIEDVNITKKENIKEQQSFVLNEIIDAINKNEFNVNLLEDEE